MSAEVMASDSGSIWIFGYGSLIWRPCFKHSNVVKGFVKGWKRRFWQGSRDHRGTEEFPGRVVTLLPQTAEDGSDPFITFGSVYKVEAEDKEAVLSYLDVREKGGYLQAEVDVFLGTDPTRPESVVKALVYTATETNTDYLGPASAESIAAQIAKSHGPSGPNSEYLLKLAECLHEWGVHDPHVHELEAHVKRLLQSSTSAPLAASVSTISVSVTTIAASSPSLANDPSLSLPAPIPYSRSASNSVSSSTAASTPDGVSESDATSPSPSLSVSPIPPASLLNI